MTKIAKNTLAIFADSDATLENPITAAISEITRQINVTINITNP